VFCYEGFFFPWLQDDFTIPTEAPERERERERKRKGGEGTKAHKHHGVGNETTVIFGTSTHARMHMLCARTERGRHIGPIDRPT